MHLDMYTYLHLCLSVEQLPKGLASPGATKVSRAAPPHAP